MQFLLDLTAIVVQPTIYPQSLGSGTTNGATADMGLQGSGSFSTSAILNVGAITGTTPTLNVKMQQSPDGTNWSDVAGATFTQVTAANQVQTIQFLRDYEYVRAVATVGGTAGPTFLANVEVVGQPRSSGSATGFSRSPSV